MSRATKTISPVDQRGLPIHRSMGLPVLSELYLGSASQWAIIFDLSNSKHEARVFTGMSIRNPSSGSQVILAAIENLPDTPYQFMKIGIQQFWTLDNLMFGPGFTDESENPESSGYGKCKYILGKLDVAQGTQASMTIDYSGSGNPSDGDTITVDGYVFEFSDDQSVAPGRYKVTLGGSADVSWQNFVTVLNLAQRSVFATINTGTDIVTLTANLGGTSGNGIAVSDSGTGATLSGSTAGGTGGVLVTHHIW